MNAPEDRNGLREALARCIDPDAWRVWDDWKDRPDGRMYVAAVIYRDKSLSKADALIAGPLALLIAERDGCAALAGEALGQAMTLLAIHERWKAASVDESAARIITVICDECREAAQGAERRALAAEAENTRLKEGMEAALAKAFDAGFDISAEGWNAEYGVDRPDGNGGYRVARERAVARLLETLSPKEQPHG